MKYYLFVIMIFPLLSFNKPDFDKRSDGSFILPASQLGPIYFFYNVPSRIRLNEGVDLSFSRSSLISLYRYKLEIPAGKVTRIDKNLMLWSSWKTEDFAKIIIPNLDIPGTYKFVIEYRTGSGDMTKMFEKGFEVNSTIEVASNVISKPRTTQPSPEPSIKPGSLARKTAQVTTGPKDKPISQTTALTGNKESRTPDTHERKTGTSAAENAAVPKDAHSATKLVVSSTPAKQTTINRVTRPVKNSKRNTPQIEKLTFPSSDITLFVSNNVISADRPVNYHFIGSDATRVINKSESASPAKELVYIEKLSIYKPANSFIEFENINLRHELAAYNPPLIKIDEQAIIEESSYDDLNTSVINKIPVATDFSLIFKNDTLINHSELISEKHEYQLEPLTASVETIAGTSLSVIPENDVFTFIPGTVDNIATLNYNDLLLKAIEENDTALFRKSILNGGGNGLIGSNGGNVFHILNGTLGNEYSVSILKKNGISIDKQDDNGNSPLHIAILNGDFEYTRFLINQGADMNIKNNTDLSPLHLTAFLNSHQISGYLMEKGAVVDIKGNSGYTPLHIASELNNYTLVKQLLNHGAKTKHKTDQKLSPASIAKIQKNDEIFRLLTRSGNRENKTDTVDFTWNMKYHVLDPRFKFTLIYNNDLAAKRQLFSLAQIITAPLAVILSAGVVYIKSEANHYYSLSEIAETEEEARTLYNKTKKLDRSAYITAGVSLISAYGFIHSTLRKKNVTGRMYKTFK
jgi:ankyrin repeat protein